MRNRLALIAGILVAVPLPALALYHDGGTPGRSESGLGQQRAALESAAPTASADAPPAATPRGRGLLREARHAERLQRVQGFVLGMTNRLTNLSQRVARHLTNIERRIAALQAAGHAITVDVELANARAKSAELQAQITKLVSDLSGLGDEEQPRQAFRAVRQEVRDLATALRAVRAALQELREAIRDDVRAGRPSPSPSAAGGSPSPLSTPSPASPSPSP